MTDYMTLADARTWTAFLVDDTSNKRFSTTDLDTALQGAVSACMEDFVSRGLQHFTRFQSVSTDSTGLADMSSYSPRTISGVQIEVGSSYYLLGSVNHIKKTRKDNTVRTLEVAYVPRHTFPTTTTHPLIGSGATSLGSFRTFDELCCAVAAQTLLVRNNEINPALENMKVARERSIMTMVDTPQEEDIPSDSRWYGDWLQWTYDHENQSIQLVVDVIRGR